MKTMDNFKLFSKIKTSKKVALIVHLEPDADALCSMVVMQQFLKNNFKIPQVDMFAEFKTLSQSLAPIVEGFALNPPVQNYDTAIIMDCPSVERTGKFQNIYNQAQLKINIDHHATNNFQNCIRYFGLVSSTCEIVYQILKFYKHKFTKQELGKIYAGIVTDTLSFSVGAISKQTFKVVGDCIEHIDYQNIYSQVCNSTTLKNQQVYAKVVANVQPTKNDMLITYITQQQLKELNATYDDTSGIANRLNSIKPAKLVCFIVPRGKGFYVSLRSKSGYDVSVIAKRFGGGGHIGASAYESILPLEEIIKQIKTEFSKQLKVATSSNTQIF